MLLATLLIACNGTTNPGTQATDDATEVAVTGWRPAVEPVDSALDTGMTQGQTGDTSITDTAPEPESNCFDEVDDDKDGLVDCDDPDCDGTPACATEICDDGIDNEADGFTDCLDPDCELEPLCESPCADVVLTGPPPLQYSGNTSGQGDNTQPSSCGSAGGAPDLAFAYTAPTDGTYTFDTFGSAFDTTLYLYNGCEGREVTCNDDAGGLQSEVSANMTAGQVVIIIVDGYGSSSGNFRLNIRN